MQQKKVAEIALELIDPNPNQPRKLFCPEELEELRNSILEYGVLQPIIVNRQDNGRYYLIAGERRLRACRLAGLEKIPAMIKDSSSKDIALMSIVENVQRENLSFMEEARAYKQLMTEYDLTQGEIANCVGKKQSTISNKIRILSLPQDIQIQVVENRLTERHARALLKLSDDMTRKKVVERIIKNGLNVRQSEKLINDLSNKHNQLKIADRRKGYFNYKIYTNSFRKLYTEIRRMETDVKLLEEDKGDYIELLIKIPKSKAK